MQTKSDLRAPVIVTTPNSVQAANVPVVSASIQIGEEKNEVWYRLPASDVGSSNETLLASTLFPAMREGRALQIRRPISLRLLQNALTIQKIFRTWDLRSQEIVIDASSVEIVGSNLGRGVGCFFTGGLDSFYTVLKHKEEITHLVFVHGFDVSINDLPLRAKVSESLRRLLEVFRSLWLRWRRTCESSPTAM